MTIHDLVDIVAQETECAVVQFNPGTSLSATIYLPVARIGYVAMAISAKMPLNLQLEYKQLSGFSKFKGVAVLGNPA